MLITTFLKAESLVIIHNSKILFTQLKIYHETVVLDTEI